MGEKRREEKKLSFVWKKERERERERAGGDSE